MRIFPISVFAFSFLILPAVSAEAGESASTDVGIRSEVSAVSRSAMGSASSSVSSAVRNSGGEMLVEVGVSAEADGERNDVKEVSRGEDVAVREESDSGNVVVTVSTDIGEAEDGSGLPEGLETGGDEASAAVGEGDASEWWSGMREWFLGWFR